jgi:hypothetical protein
VDDVEWVEDEAEVDVWDDEVEVDVWDDVVEAVKVSWHSLAGSVNVPDEP